MADPVLGLDSWFGWGKETTPGTAVSVDKWIRCSSMGFGLRHAPIQPAVLSLGSRVVKGGRKWVDGPIEAPFTWTGQEELIELAMGSIATTVAEASTRWLHTFKNATSLSAMTAEGANESVTSCQGKGVKVNTVTFRQAVDDVVRISYDLVGQIHTTPLTTPSTESFPSDAGPSWDGWVLSIGGSASANVNGFTWAVTNNIDSNRFPLASTRTMRVPKRGAVAVSLDIDAEFQDTTELTNWLNTTEQDIELVNTGATLGTGNYKLTLDIPAGYWTGDYPSTGDPGPVTQRLAAIGTYDSTNATYGLIKIENATATP